MSPLHDRVIKSIKSRQTWVKPLKVEPSKAELKAMLKQAVANTAKIKVKKK